MTRRNLVRLCSAAPLTLIACGRKKSPRYQGYFLIANYDSRSIAVINLSSFQLLTNIPVSDAPFWVLAAPSRSRAFVISAESSAMEVLNLDSLHIESRVTLGGKPQSARITEDGATLWLALREPESLVGFHTRSLQCFIRKSLPSRAADMDLHGSQIAIAFAEDRRVANYSVREGLLAMSPRLTSSPHLVRLRSDGKILLTGNTDDRTITAIDAVSLQALVDLPLALAPRQFCFNSDGGQLFVTGDGLDAVAIVSPYQTEVGETILAGRAPGCMAATTSDPQYLFVSNPESGDLTVINIQTRHVLAQISVGLQPGPVLLTPDNEYALVLNEHSGDVAVIRLLSIRQATLTSRRSRMAPLFTLIRVGSRPVSGVIAPR